MYKKRICLIGQFPPPIHGLAKALETIRVSEYLKEKFVITHINITDNKKFVSHVKNIRRNDSDIYYFTISHSKFGNIRDQIILNELVKKQKKVIIHYHGGYFRELYNKMNFMQKKINDNLLAKVDNVIVLSQGLKRLFKGIVDESKIKICENYVEDASLLSQDEFVGKMKKMREKEHIDILYLSNFIKSKGYFDVLEVARTYKDKPIKFHFAGKFFSQDDENEFKNFITTNNLNNVHFYGVVDGEQKKKLITNSDVSILPTYYHIEGQPISLIEAMANGLTIITTNHAGIPDIVTKKNGYIVEPQNLAQIGSAVQDLVLNREKLIEYGYTNREYALVSFKEIDYIKRLEKIFNEV
ncbi:glycosyltransferase family 4 protein [Bacillus cereus]|uniref:glycosyltransferase family 4 protein n=1 Tax=Bacillus cereus TaxID=1396 RepID=UPI00363F7421